MCHGAGAVAVCGGLMLASIAILFGAQTQYASEYKLREAAVSQRAHHVQAAENDSISPGGRWERIFWVLQVSDLHLSKYHPSKQKQFDDFLGFLPVFSPKLVMVTGDITDANKGITTIEDRGQNRAEWEQYRRSLERASVLANNVTWLDLPGNHDMFNVPSYASEDNLFRIYSVSGERAGRYGLDRQSAEVDDGTGSVLGAQTHHGYSYVHRERFGTYKFIALDGCTTPAPARHFFGVLSQETIDFARRELAEATAARTNHSIVFGHYPITSLVDDDTVTSAAPPARLRRPAAAAAAATTPPPPPQQQAQGSSSSSSSSGGGGGGGQDIHDLFTRHGVVVYVAGHLHTFLGGALHPWLGSAMHARLPGGTLELELGDFKSTRRVRVMAIDHDLLSFADTPLGQWPVVVITNPKSARHSSSFEPLHRQRASTHIRVLLFSPHPIQRASVAVDGAPLGELQPATKPAHADNDNDNDNSGGGGNTPQPDSNGLYVLPWDASQFSAGLHTITVSASDVAGNARDVTISFSLDGTPAAQASAFSQTLLALNMRTAINTVATLLYLAVAALLLASLWTARRLDDDPAASAQWWRFVTRQLCAEDAAVAASRCGTGRLWLLLGLPVFSSMAAPTAAGAGSGGAKAAASLMDRARYALFPYVVLARQRPALCSALLLFLAYLPLGPWFTAEVSGDNTWGVVFLWGMVYADPGHGGTVVLPNYDAGIRVILVFVTSVLPFLQFMSIQSYARHTTRQAAEHTRCYHSSSGTSSLPGVLLLAVAVLGGGLEVALLARFWGIITALLSPVCAWLSLALLLVMIHSTLAPSTAGTARRCMPAPPAPPLVAAVPHPSTAATTAAAAAVSE